MKTIQENHDDENTEISPYSVKNVGYIHRKANIIYIWMIRIGLDQTGNCQVPELPEDVNYTQKFALTKKSLLLPGQGGASPD